MKMVQMDGLGVRQGNSTILMVCLLKGGKNTSNGMTKRSKRGIIPIFGKWLKRRVSLRALQTVV